MSFQSILYPEGFKIDFYENEPLYFKDLNLDKIFNMIAIHNKNILPYFYTPIRHMETISYRQEITKDIENDIVRKHIKIFAENISIINNRITFIKKRINQNVEKTHYLSKGELLLKLNSYAKVIREFIANLDKTIIRSSGLKAFVEYLREYINDDKILEFEKRTKNLLEELQKIDYLMQLKGKTFKILDSDIKKDDFTEKIVKLLDRFVTVPDLYAIVKKKEEAPFAEHVETAIIDLVSNIHKDTFGKLNNFIEAYIDIVESKIILFAKEIEFYLTYIDYIGDIKTSELNFCYPEMTSVKGDIYNKQGFDLALAHNLTESEKRVVCNDFEMSGKERIIYISGSNQGGKTTFARAFGQIHYLAELGLPVPGKESKLLLFDNIFTHFEKRERIEDLNGKLVQELDKLKDIIQSSTPSSIIVLNEVLNSTALKDAIQISKKIMKKIEDIDCLCLNVTFIDEIIKTDDLSISMVSQGTENYKPEFAYIIKKDKPNGLAHAVDIVRKYGLTYETIKERLSR